MNFIKLFFLTVVIILAAIYFYFWHVRFNPETGQMYPLFEHDAQCQTLADAIYADIEKANHCETNFDCAVNGLPRNAFVCNDVINSHEKLFSTKIKLFFYEQKKCLGYDDIKTCREITREDISCVDNRCVGPKP